MSIFSQRDSRLPLTEPKTLPEMASFLEGLSISPGFIQAAENLRLAASFMRRAEHHVCGQGYIGCPGGPKCGSDHK